MRNIAEIEKSELRYRSIFENCPISLWEEDMSAVKAFLNQLLASGVKDLDGYFESHLNDVIACVRMVKIIDTNNASLKLCRAADKGQLLAGLPVIFNDDTLPTFQRELVAIGNGATFYAPADDELLRWDRRVGHAGERLSAVAHRERDQVDIGGPHVEIKVSHGRLAPPSW